MYQIQFTPEFERDFKKLDRHIAKKILDRVYWLSENMESVKIGEVAFVPKDLSGLKKYRFGDWRLLFWLDRKDRAMVLYGIEHRKSIYRRF